MTPLTPRTMSCCLLFVALVSPPPNHAADQPNNAPDNHVVQAAMKNVMYHFTDHIAVHIIQLQGHLIPTKPGAIVVFDDKNSFTLALTSAEIAITCNALAQVLNEDVFSSADSPIRAISIESKNNQLIIKGKLPRKGDVPFETAGTISVDGDGRIRLHTEHVKAAHVPVKGLLDLLGIELAQLINTKKVPGLAVDKDDLLLDPEQILPPPHIQGKVTAVRIQGDEVIQIFGVPQKSNFAAKQSGNYMAYRENELRFGKLTMHDADLILIDMNPQDPFDFYLDHYKDQLVAGYTKTTPESGLRVYARDYNKLRHQAAASQPGK
jgi:hypothetical protein